MPLTFHPLLCSFFARFHAEHPPIMSLPSIPGPEASCIFCKVVAGTLQAEILYSGERVIAILDRYPIHPGHALIIPRGHYRDLLHLPPDSFQEIVHATQMVARALVGSLKLEGFNVFSNNGEIAGQSVFHFHIHVTPRFRDDMIRFVHGQSTYGPGEMAAYGERIRNHIHASSFEGV
jgi:histidine triad (HIT) family protein